MWEAHMASRPSAVSHFRAYSASELPFLNASLKVGGMTCEHCGARVQAALEAVEGVESAEVSLAAETANVVGSASAESLIEAVEDMGKSASLADAGAGSPSGGGG